MTFVRVSMFLAGLTLIVGGYFAWSDHLAAVAATAMIGGALVGIPIGDAYGQWVKRRGW